MLKNGLTATIMTVIMAIRIRKAAPVNKTTFIFFFIVSRNSKFYKPRAKSLEEKPKQALRLVKELLRALVPLPKLVETF